MSPKLKAQLRRCVNLPSPPGVAVQIIELAQDPETGFDAIAETVVLDPALCAKILRTANSSLYIQRCRCHNLREALILLGLNATIMLALSFSLVGSLRTSAPSGLDFKRYWRRVLLAAIAARVLGRALGRSDGEELFLAGLLQDIGMLALDRAVPDLYASAAISRRGHDDLRALEHEQLGTDHAVIGGWLLRRWHLPERLCRAVEASHMADGMHGEAVGEQQFMRCVALSGLLAALSETGETMSEALSDLTERAERLLGLEPALVHSVLEQMREHLPEAEALFEIELGGAGEIDLLLEQARELMVVRQLQTMQEARSLHQTAVRLESRNQELEERSRRDTLTGLYNRTYLEELLAREFQQAKEQGRAISLIFADLDKFKYVNDTLGHRAGDEILRSAARILNASTRRIDAVARYGGDEFVIVLPESGRRAAQVVAERILRAFGKGGCRLEGYTEMPVTISIGVATRDGDIGQEAAANLLWDADRALYAAKSAGGNRMLFFDAPVACS